MEDICEKCGLPKNICACSEIAKDSQKISINLMKRRFRKLVTVITGFDDEKMAKDMSKELKRALACGGISKGTEIELQGDHKNKVKEFLLKKMLNSKR